MAWVLAVLNSLSLSTPSTAHIVNSVTCGPGIQRDKRDDAAELAELSAWVPNSRPDLLLPVCYSSIPNYIRRITEERALDLMVKKSVKMPVSHTWSPRV